MYLKRIFGILSIAILNVIAFPVFPIVKTEINNHTLNFTKKTLTLDEGLCSDEVKQIYKDNDGFIWIATKNGLSLYDGHSFTTFKSNLHNWNLLSSNDVTCIVDDETDRLWIGTADGLNVLDKHSGTFRQIDYPTFKNNPIAQILPLSDGNIMVATDRGLIIYKPKADSCTIVTRQSTGDIMPQTAIKSLLQDSKGYIWIGTWNEGLFRYDPKSGKYVSYPKLNGQNSAHYIFEDSNCDIWIGTWGYGLQKLKNPYDLEKLSWDTYANVPGNANTIINNTIYTITEDLSTHTIWIGTPAGISVLDMNGRLLANFYPSNDQTSISGGEVNSILAEENGTLWIGMLGSGINIFDFTPSQDFSTNSLHDIQAKLQSNSVRSILIDSSNKMWLGIGTQHLVQIDMETGQWKCDEQIPGFANAHGYTVMAMTQSKSTGKIWIGTYDGGLMVYDPAASKVDTYKQENTQWIPGNRIYAITEDKKNQMWIGTQNGFGMYSPSGGTFARFDNIKAGELNINEITVNSIIEDKNGVMWIATRTSGIIRVEGEGGNASQYAIKTYTPENGGLNAINAMNLLIDSKNRMWVGTQGGGLSLYDPLKDIFIPKHAEWELPGDDIYSILSDSKGNLWMATNNGLVNLIFTDGEPEGKPMYRLYTVANGLQSNIFNTNVVFKKADGKMFFGGHHGYNCFYPERIETADFNAPIAITDIFIHGKSWMTLDAGKRARISNETPNFTKEITLDYKQNNFSIEFAALDYKNPEQDRYSYMLKGYSDEWRYVDEKHRYAQYNNLAPGTYEFVLRATNSSGKWIDRPQTLKIKILPPPWLSWWAYSIYAILLLALIILGYRFAKKKIRLYNERELEKFISDKAEEMNHAKLQFFTNITHELLTPLTIISASIEELKANAPQYKDTYKAMLVNTNRLIRLIQQILEFRKAETGNLKLKVSQGDLAAFVRNCTNSFKPLMKKKDIHFSVECNPEPLHAYFDTDKIDKILYNLLSNASKYNKEGGNVWITLTLSANKKNAILSVKDDGEGMTTEAQKTLFQRFYEGDYRKYNTSGTGIGLSLAKDLVQLHQGTIEGHSEPGKGMEFVIKIPINREAYSEDCIDDSRDQLPIVQREIIVDDDESNPEADKSNIEDPQPKGLSKESKRNVKQYTLLLVEDNSDLLQVMARLLSHEYNVMTAHNGKEATEIITNNDINLIISDIMMPDTDGLQFCKYIKSHLETSHIPVILLTAKDREEDRIEAYQSGADAYIKKPFNLSLLQARITNLLKTHERANKDFKKQLVFDVNELNYTSIDEEFLKKAISIVQEHLSDPDYDQSRFVEDMGTSKSTLFRKLKSLTGLSYSSFVRNIRIKAACQIMEEKRHIRISELAYAIGFNDPKYFSACFKKEFGIHPSEYMKRFVDDSGEITDDTNDEEDNDKQNNETEV